VPHERFDGRFVADVRRVTGDADDAAAFGHRSDLLVRQVPAVRIASAGIGMGRDHRIFRHVEHVLYGLGSGLGDIDQHP